MTGLAVLSSLLSVNTFPFVTNDGVVYLEHSRALAEGGLVVAGYRQVGYPLFLAVLRSFANFVGAEPLLATALLQRLLLINAGVLAFLKWRWWSLPLVAFLFVPMTVAYSNFLLTESVGISIAALLVISAISFLEELRRPQRLRSSRLLMSGVIAALTAVFLFFLRFTYAVFGVIPLVMGIAGWRTRYRRLGAGLLVTYLVVVGAFTFALSSENESEFGVFGPSTGGEATRYYHAWYQVFLVHPENRTDPTLAEYFDEGNVHDFETQVIASGVAFEERVALFESETADMLAAAGISEFGSRVESMVWSLAGGRLHDLAGGVAATMNSKRSDVDELMSFNFMARSRGLQGFADALNDGQMPEAVITDPIGVPPPLVDSQLLARFLVPLSIIVMSVGLAYAPLRWISVAGLLIVLATAAGVGWIRADSYRFLLVSSAAGITAATSVASGVAHDLRQRKATKAGNQGA